MINDSEMEDFLEILSRKGLKEDDFTIEKRRDPIGADVQPVTGTVRIQRLSTGREETYSTGHISAWPTEFANDYDAGVFG